MKKLKLFRIQIEIKSEKIKKKEEIIENKIIENKEENKEKEDEYNYSLKYLIDRKEKKNIQEIKDQLNAILNNLNK